jgi:hypothetical protein
MAVLTLAACQEEDEMSDGEDTCGRSGYESLIGTNIAAVTLPAELNHRVLGPDDAGTMDFVPERLNIRTDEDGVIVGLDCG